MLTSRGTGSLLLIFRDPVLRLLGADADTYRYASEYYTWLSAGSPVVMASFIHSNLLRSEGMSRESMAGTVSGAVVNMILDPILISAVGLGAAGAAIATVAGYFVRGLCIGKAGSSRLTCGNAGCPRRMCGRFSESEFPRRFPM